MKILVICQYYYPEPFRITNICEELAKLGHELLVVTGTPNYPEGIIYSGYESNKRKDETINGVRVHRCYNIGRKGGIVKRFLNYYSYVLSSLLYVSKIKEEFDIVFVNQLSPVMMAYAGIKYKNKFKKRLILYCLDLWPESLVAGGISNKSIIFKLFHKISKNIYKNADDILVTSYSFIKYFQDKFGINRDKIQYLPQYAEEIFTVESCKKETNGYLDLMFAGNIGKAQSLETIIRAANETKDIENLRWHIVGEGSELENIKKLTKELSVNSVFFHGRKELSKMPEYYAMADMMIVSLQKDPILSMTLPGKIQSYMAAGKPIFAIADGEIANVISKSECGFCVDAEDYMALAKNVSSCYLNNKLGDYAKNSRKYYENNFKKDIIISELINTLNIQN